MTEGLISTNKNVIKLCLPLGVVSFILFICGFIFNNVEKLALYASAVFSFLVAIIIYCYATEKAQNQHKLEMEQIKDEASKISKIHYALHLANPQAKLKNKITFALKILSEMLPEATFCCYLCQNNNIEFVSATRNKATNEIEIVLQEDPVIVEITAKINSLTNYDNIQQYGFTKPLTISDADKVYCSIIPIDFYSTIFGLVVKIGKTKLPEETETRILQEFCKGLAIVIDNHKTNAVSTPTPKVSAEQQNDTFDLVEQLYESMQVSAFPSLPSWSIAKYFVPSTTTNRADFLDYIDTSVNKQLIILGKCSGRGLSASMYINKLKLMIRCFAEECPTPAHLLNKLSIYLSTDLMPDNFVDMIAIQISPLDNQVCLAMAGNTSPIINRTRNGFAELPQLEAGIPLGLFNQGTEPYKNQYIDTTPGDGIIIHTDGITDFPAKGKERVTNEDIKNILEKLPEQSAEDMLNNLVREITGNNSGEIPEEDHSIVFLKAE